MANIICRLHLSDGTTFDFEGMDAEAAKRDLAIKHPLTYPEHVKVDGVTFHTAEEIAEEKR